MKTKGQILSVVVLVLFALYALPARNIAAAQGSIDPQELQVFLDSVISHQLEAYHIPGATVSVVKNGQLLFAKGYGYADLTQRKPAIADQTLFGPGSIAKLFTWTAVMQLVEQGWNLAARIHYTLVALAAVALVWWLNYWNLLGLKLQ
jgi:CubicO group peptidase (beta-lactamase class C family)